MTNQDLIKKLATENQEGLINQISEIKESMKKLRFIFSNKPQQFRTHSDVSRHIGHIVINPSITNHEAYLAGREYLNEINNLFVANHIYGKAREELNQAIEEVRITNFSYESALKSVD